MRVAISTACLFNRKVNEDTVRLFKENGLENVEVFLTSFSEYKPSFVKKLKKHLKGMNVNSVHPLGTQFESQLFNKNERVRKDAYLLLDKFLRAGQLLGAKYYSFHGLARYKKDMRSYQREEYAFWGECFEKIQSEAKKYGITVCLETVEWGMFSRPEVYGELKKYAPSLVGLLDIKQARLSERDYSEYISAIGKDLRYLHISDVDDKGKICLPSKNGTFDFDELIERLKAVGFDGTLVIEVYSADYKDEAELFSSVKYVEGLLRKHGVLSR